MRVALISAAVVFSLVSFSSAIPKALERDAVTKTSSAVPVKTSDLSRSEARINMGLIPLRPV